MEDTRNLRRLPESELDIMLCVWSAGEEGTTAPEIAARLDRPLTASALHSYLKRLEEKGFLACARVERANRYTALVSREAYQKREGKNILEKLYGNSLKRFTAALYDGGSLTPKDLAELREYLDALEGGADR